MGSNPLGVTMCFQRLKSIVVLVLTVILFLSLSGCLESDDVQKENTDMLNGSAADIEDNLTASLEYDTMLSETLTVTSSAFEDGGAIPAKYTCDGENINPGMEISGVPENAESLLLIMDDPDAPMGTFTHWVVWNISVASQIEENSIPGVEGKNSVNQASYTGPCPPSGTHRYFFRIYVLDIELDLESGSDREFVEDAMSGHVLAYGELMGTYSRI